MTNQWTDVKKTDCTMVCGSNCAESHPIAFKWIEASRNREKDPAKLIVVDPRFTRTAARADIYAQIRPGTDIVFFGGLINYALSNNTIQWEYVNNYTNASYLVNPGYSFDAKTGLFAGYNAEKRKYDPAKWAYQFDKYGPDGKPTADAKPVKDPTYANPNTVLNILKAHYARYTPEKVEAITGIPKDKFLEIAKTYCATSEPAKSGNLMYAMGLAHHSVGTQNIRAFALLQLLLGNTGMPGGGINALRGESNVQSSTDFALLWNNLPGYLAAINSTTNPTLQDYVTKFVASKGTGSFWANAGKWMVSFLKSMYGDNATAANQFGFDWMPKVQDGKNYSHIALFEAMYAKEKGKEVKGLLLWGQNPCVGGPNANMEAKALENLNWMVAIDLWETETSVFWKRPGANAADIDTEVFLLPAAASIEKEGSVTNSGRVIQWRYKAANPPGEAKSDGAIVSLLMTKLKELYEADGGPNAAAINSLYWPYDPEEPSSDEILKEINGYTTADKKQLANFTKLAADGSTTCGIWIFSGVYAPDPKDPAKTVKNFSKRTDNEDVGGVGIYPKWAFAWPVNRRIIYNRCSTNPAGVPWNADKTLVKWDGAKWVNTDVPDFFFKQPLPGEEPTLPPANSAVNSYIMQPWGVGHLFAPTGLTDGPLPEHYEPVESPFKNTMSDTQYNPAVKVWNSEMDKLAPVGDKNYPIVGTTWRLTEHWQAGQMTRNLPWLAELQPEMIVEMSKNLADRKGISNGDTVTVKSARGQVNAVALVTDRIQVLTVNGQKCDVIGMPWHYGYTGYVIGGPSGKSYAANQLTPHIGDANTMVPEYKAFVVDVNKA